MYKGSFRLENCIAQVIGNDTWLRFWSELHNQHKVNIGSTFTSAVSYGEIMDMVKADRR